MIHTQKTQSALKKPYVFMRQRRITIIDENYMLVCRILLTSDDGGCFSIVPFLIITTEEKSKIIFILWWGCLLQSLFTIVVTMTNKGVASDHVLGVRYQSIVVQKAHRLDSHDACGRVEHLNSIGTTPGGMSGGPGSIRGDERKKQQQNKK